MEYFFNFDKMTYLKGNRPEGCILCLLKDEDPKVDNLIVHRSGSFIVSLNLYPYNPGHLIVFPIRHILDIRNLSKPEHEELNELIDRSLNVLDRTHGAQGYNIGYNMGLAAGASIEHLHLHIIPRYPREIGIAELIAGQRVLVEDPLETQKRLSDAFSELESLSPQ